MLDSLLEIVRSENVDDTKVIDLVFVLVILVRGPNTTFVLVEDKILALGLILLWKLIGTIGQNLRVCLLDSPPQFSSSMFTLKVSSVGWSPAKLATLSTFRLSRKMC